MITQRPVGCQNASLSNILTEEELNYMKQMAAERFDMIMTALRSMPRSMLLTIR
jgi:hypothetical protein